MQIKVREPRSAKALGLRKRKRNRNRQEISLFCLLVATLIGLSVHSAEIKDERNLRDAILSRGKVLQSIEMDSVKIDSLESQVSDFIRLVKILDYQIDSLSSSYEKSAVNCTIWPLPLLKDDESIFEIENIRERKVPLSIEKHYNVACMVSEIVDYLNKTDKNIADVKSIVLRNDKIDLNEMIQQVIQDDVDTIIDLFDKLDQMDQSTLSQTQKHYIDSLKDRYNNLSQYFE